MAEQDITEGKLAGWKQIADFLGVSERTARGYEKSLNLPVHRFDGLDKSRVWAYPPELNTWKGRQAAVGRANGNESPAPEVGGVQLISTVAAEPPSISAPAPLTTLQSNGKSGAVAAAPNLWQRLNRRRWLFGVGAFGILLIGPVIYWLLDPHGPMVDFQVDGATLIGINAKRQALWQRTFPRHLMSWPYENPTRPVVTWLGDLDGDGRSNLLFTAVSSKDAGPVDDQLLCFDDHGRMKWKRPFTPGRPVRDMGGVMVPPFSIVRVLVMTGRTPDETLIVVSSIHHEDQPCQVAILDRHGRVLAEYWHPGHLGHMIQADLDGDGRNELH